MSVLTFRLDALRFRRVLHEVNAPGVEKLYMVSSREDDEAALQHYLATEPTDHLFIVERVGEPPTERVLFIAQNPEHRQVLADAIRKVLHINDQMIRGR